ncbi:hypothetical protein [Acidiphilium acidophilum]|uniref:Uncharacterized protein n=1 Tax=Acidiphilium acidophilum TaxID=76588 RepID=A0AAW9DM93_ACIAO|nr:hypothetical protein [Acidiphilium acidophilum]MDX5929553.1 hypothetical protein [Acidiphilium acidophilum]
MDTVIAGQPDQGQDFDRIIRTAQDEFIRAADLGGIAGDPAEKLFRAFTTHLTALRAVHFSERQIAGQRIDRLDARLLSIKQVQDDLKITGTIVSKLAQDEINAAHAKMGQSIIQSIAKEVKTQMHAQARAAWVMSIVCAAGLMVLAGIGGLAYGYHWDRTRIAASLRDGNALLGAIADTQGPKAVTDWNMLMRYNPIVSVMKECHGINVSYQQHGRKACQMVFWIAPVPQRKPPV